MTAPNGPCRNVDWVAPSQSRIWHLPDAGCLSLSGHSGWPALLAAALKAEGGLSTAAEILDNTSRYDPKRIAAAIIDYFSQPNRSTVFERDSRHIAGELSSDFLRFSNTRLLNQLIEDCCNDRTHAKDLIVGYCVFELLQRRIPSERQVYKKAAAAYGNGNFLFGLSGLGTVSLSSVEPDSQ